MSMDMTAAEFNAMQKKPGRSKYGAKRTEVDGITFASKAEARRYSELKLMLVAGDIHGLMLQPSFDLHVNGMKVCRYVADFEYYRAGSSEPTIEDVKGVLTPAYRLKKKLMRAIHAINIVEVK